MILSIIGFLLVGAVYILYDCGICTAGEFKLCILVVCRVGCIVLVLAYVFVIY